MTDRSRLPFRPMNCHKTVWIMLQLLWLAVWINPALGNFPPRPKDFDEFAQTAERSPKGTIISTLTATDADGPQQISFQIDPDSVEPNLVTLSDAVGDSLTGRSVNVSLNVDDLDSDYNSDERRITILMSDGINQPVSVTISLFIIDINDVAPEFQKKPYRASIKENAAIGSLVFNKTEIVDPDHGLGGSVTYSLETISQTNDEAYKNTFNATLFEGYIHLYGRLDYETHNFYQLMLTATDGGGLNSTTDVIVTVIDVQDTPPSFVNTPYSLTVKENATVGSSVISVSALDGDRGQSNPISYRFIGETYGDIFNIERSTGSITVAKSLSSSNVDLSPTGSVFALNVLAEEIEENLPQEGETTASVLVTIRLEDINDNSPVFDRTNYQATVEENSQRGIPIQFINVSDIFVQDLDKDKNSQFEVSVLTQGGLPYDVFSVSPSSVFSSVHLNVLVNNSVELDYEELFKTTGGSTLTFKLQALETQTDEKHTGDTTLTVTVIDVNDNFPQFNQTGYQVEIEENAANGTIVTTISATDADSGKFGEISYKFVRGADGKFAIDNNGVVRVLDGRELDREKLDTYYLTVEAEDGGGNKNTSQLIITLLDMNDNTPRFLRTEYSSFLEENTQLRILLLSASDGDKAGTLNSKVTYELSYVPPGLNGNFTIETINSEGNISISPNLDFESLDESLQEEIRLEVTAIDQGSPPRSSTVNVTISVQDKNDISPIFSPSSYVTKIDETADGEDFVVNVTASDGDGKPPNNRVQYSINRGGFDRFFINPSSGSIIVAPGAKFDHDAIGQYNLTVLARDLGSPQRTGTCDVTVTILDINNKNPEFVPNTKSFSIYENSSESFVVGSFSATDLDATHLLEYSILKDKITGKGETGTQITDDLNLNKIKDYFLINNANGLISVNSTDLDRELAEEIQLTIHVKDLNAVVNPNQQTATGLVTITLLDTNDNPPDFSQPEGYSVTVSEREAVGYDVVIVSATDKDKDQTVTFQLEDPLNNFQIDSNSVNLGQITLLKKLDRETDPLLSFKVIATDSGSPALSSTVIVNVTVQDVNDNNPQFVNPDERITVQEGQLQVNSIFNISATDKDDMSFGTVHYFIDSGDIEGKFRLNSTTGELFLVSELDREKIAMYELRLEARDNINGEPTDRRLTFTQVTIIVTDVNDEIPDFNGTTFKVKDPIFENTAENAFVYTLTAQDKDVGNNALLTYSLGTGASDTNASSSNGQPLFKIDSNNGMIRVNQSLKDYAGMWYLTVIATDKSSLPKSASATVLVDILDVNNYAPIIDDFGATIYFKEDPNGDKFVFNFTATDNDKGTFGEFTFHLTNSRGVNEDNTVFKLDPNTGILKTKVGIDYENKTTQSFTLYIQARDKGTPVRSSPITTVFIQITDADDNPPIFSGSRDTPTMFQVEEAATGVIGQVKATDKDTEVNTPDICYCFIGNHANFSLDIRDGTIMLLEKIDRELTPEPRDLVIQALPFCNKCGSTKRRRRAIEAPSDYNKTDPTMLWVRVAIKDINDNKPIFTSPEISVGITQDTQFGTDILSISEFVEDADEDSNNTRHIYSLKGGVSASVDNLANESPSNMFKILTTGVVKTNAYFKDDWFGFFSFIVEVKDAAGNSTANVKVYLINEDQQVKIVILDSLESVNKTKALIVKRLENATGGMFEIIVDRVKTHASENGKSDPSKIDLFIHGVEKSTKKVIPGADLLRMIDSKLKLLIETYRQYSVVEVLPAVASKEGQDDKQPFMMALILVAIILGILVFVLGFTFYVCRRKYKRKLRAATAMAFVNTGIGAKESEMSKMDMPGTNLHAFEGSNPIWMEKYDNIGLDNDSQNSLDANEIQTTGLNQFDEQEVSMDLYNDDYDINKFPGSKMASKDLHLNAAIREHEAAKNHKNNIANNNEDKYAMNGSVKQSNGSIDGLTTFNTTKVNGLPTTEI